jgi:hypothetical protein
VNCRCNAALSNALEPPRGLRKPATTTLVSNTNLTY